MRTLRVALGLALAVPLGVAAVLWVGDALRYLDVATDTLLEQPCEAVFLAAGALATGAIFLRTLQQARPDLGPHSESLMDTAVVKLPYLMPRAIGRA